MLDILAQTGIALFIGVNGLLLFYLMVKGFLWLINYTDNYKGVNRMERIQGYNWPTVRDIVHNDKLTNIEKASQIYNFNYDLACKITDGFVNVSKLMSRQAIVKILEDN